MEPVPANGDNQRNSLYRWKSRNRRSLMHRTKCSHPRWKLKATEHTTWNTRADTWKTTIETNKYLSAKNGTIFQTRQSTWQKSRIKSFPIKQVQNSFLRLFQALHSSGVQIKSEILFVHWSAFQDSELLSRSKYVLVTLWLACMHWKTKVEVYGIK